GVDPRLLLETDHGRTLPTEVSSRIIGAWNILQLTFRSFDPAVYPALDFLLACSSRLARLTDGVVADPIAEAYRLPAEIPAPHDPGRPFTRSLHVSLQSRAEGGLLRLFTRGMRKFDLPEFEIVELTPDTAEKGAAVLAALADLSLSGRGLKAGDALNLDGLRVLLAPGGLDRGLWEGIACLEVLPEGPEPMSRSLTSWSPGR
ncbi:MAG: hypothetical protein MH204_01025, partial [Fimbriimonadaceae bacterium]|nr:hypothetical protein [Fimbriimonadaceae bacterium]